MSMVLFIVAALLIVAQQCKAVADAIAHGGKLNDLGPFWSQSSWRNKYKNGDPKQGERFWGSTTVFVMFTDAWHLFTFLFDWSKNAAVIICVWRLSGFYGIAPSKSVIAVILSCVFAQILFEQSYRRLRKN